MFPIENETMWFTPVYLFTISINCSAGEGDGSRWNKVKYRNNFVWNTTPITIAANWKVSSIWINANKSTRDCSWSIANRNFSICLMWKHHVAHTIWPPIPKRTWTIGWTVYARCAICRTYRSNSTPAMIIVNVSADASIVILKGDLHFEYIFVP